MITEVSERGRRLSSVYELQPTTLANYVGLAAPNGSTSQWYRTAGQALAIASEK